MKEEEYGKEVLDFWFDPKNIPFHFEKNPTFDEEIRSKFLFHWERARKGELYHWRRRIQGRLAEIIILDQFSRNLWRNDPRSFTQDDMALVLSQEALKEEDMNTLSTMEKRFLIMPWMHSESKEIHKKALELFEELGEPGSLYFEKAHKKIIDRFGRYPHRNKILQRKTTREEEEFLKEPNSSF
ncbi:MAG: DUF924 family protein [Tissierellia bacterium]|nr:DUF924 family protein [Tissierellia bacterium]